ncbi:hypothetical protein ABZ419_16995 [Streptomyces cinnamoneus]|uniref:hypothetical protein n=1 Tax=Streptomyces cinnamoneus TaxID=53446 RepID=UPI0033E6275A
MSDIRISAAVFMTTATLLLGTSGAQAAPSAPTARTPAFSPCSLVDGQGAGDHHCVESPLVSGRETDGKHKGFTGYEVVAQTNLLVPAHDNAQAIVDCPAGKKVLGGGFFGFIPEVRAFRSFPQGSAFTAWVVVVQNDSNVTSAFDAYAICAKVDC